ncbi:hypothetical protein G7Y79_00005g017470 [Physcia stellaris]|nr:hypothetical protein G7Y79_00005g017470 [Physcia stellaris]
MHFSIVLVAAASAISGVHTSPGQELNGRNLSSAECSKVTKIVDVLKLNKATPFCSSFLSIKPATATSVIKVTSTVMKTSISTITSGTASTSVIFKPGNPSPKVRRAAVPAQSNEEVANIAPAAVERRDEGLSVPAYITAYEAAAISSACSCLSIPTPTTTAITSSIKTTTSTVVTSKTVKPPVITSTEYPCATPIPSVIPTIPYGMANQAGVIESSNSLYGSGTSGTSLEGCCNLCYFSVLNCIQAYYFFYEGCVVQQGTNVTGTSEGIGSICPNGKISGLTYNPDTAPPFRSTGTIAGPCGQTYNNL